MTTSVFTIRSDKKLLVVEEIMKWAHIRHVPVVDASGRLVGLVSHRDLLRASASAVATRIAGAERQQHLGGISVVDIMQASVQTIGSEALVQEAAGLMRRRNVGCLPVVDDGRLVGIVSEHDLLTVIERLPSKVLSDLMPPAA
jgi:acetoin utilization protein AcuB